MTEEVSTENVEVPEAEGDDGFAAAFEATVSGEEQVAAAPDPTPEPAPEEPPKPTVEELFAQMKTEFYTELGKVRDTAAGRIGELNQRMHQMLTQQRSTGGSAVKLSKDSLKRLSGEFPEMAEMIAGDLTDVLANVGGQPQFDQSAIDNMVEQRVAAAREQLRAERDAEKRDNERFKMSVIVPDWQEVVGLPDKDGAIPDTAFRRWLKTKPLDYQDKVTGSWNAREIADSIGQFRKESAVPEQQAQQRKRRFEDAVAPTQSRQSAPAPSEQDAFEAGFRKVAGR